MHSVDLGLLARIARIGAVAAGLTTLLALQPERTPVIAAAPRDGAHARALVLSDQARRYLTLEYKAFPTEFMGCMIGEIHGNAVIVHRIAPADVEPRQSTATHVVPKQTCEDAGWVGTVGVIHSHPGGERCWYFFPGTQVASSDGQSFGRQHYPVDAIMCGDRVVWLSRDFVQQQLPIGDAAPRPVAPRSHERGNRLRSGAAAPEGQD
jgi:hypothetical protein